MSLYEYQESQRISASDPPFYALIMAAFRQADSDNLRKLRCAFPLTWLELVKRYDAPRGLIGDELLEQIVKELPKTIMGIPIKVTEACPIRPGVIILGSFNDYDHREESDGTDDPSD